MVLFGFPAQAISQHHFNIIANVLATMTVTWKNRNLSTGICRICEATFPRPPFQRFARTGLILESWDGEMNNLSKELQLIIFFKIERNTGEDSVSDKLWCSYCFFDQHFKSFGHNNIHYCVQ